MHTERQDSQITPVPYTILTLTFRKKERNRILMETTLTCSTAPPLEPHSQYHNCGACNLAEPWSLSTDQQSFISHKGSNTENPKSSSELASGVNGISSDANYGKPTSCREFGLDSTERSSSGSRDSPTLKLQNKASFGDGNHESQASYEAKSASEGVIRSFNGTKTSSDCNSGGTLHGSKKMKAASSVSVSSPKCQVEGCNADLSEAKDYHRRHKVCECHSKSSKVMVARLEQRFCQQCSRFHILSEFDEGKRSCRRRLAGHNERRRKQHHEPLSLASLMNHAQYAGRKQLTATKPSPEQLYFLPHKHMPNATSFQNTMTFDSYIKRLPDQTDIRNNAKRTLNEHSSIGLELHQFIQGSSEGNVDLHMNHGLKFHNLLDLVAKNDGIVSDIQKPNEISASGRALSLLSPSMSPWNKSSSSPSNAVSSTHVDGILSENQHSTASCISFNKGSSSLMSESRRSLDVIPPLHSHGMNISSGSSEFNSSMDILQPYDFVYGNYEGPHPAPALELLQASTMDRHQMEIPFTDIKRLSIFGVQTLM